MVLRERKKTILVPWDFTPESEHALAHAYQLAQTVGDNIMLIYIRQISRWASSGTVQRIEQELGEVRVRLERVAIEREESLGSQRQELESELKERVGKQRAVFEVSIKGMVIYGKKIQDSIVELFSTLDVNMIVSSEYYTTEGERRIDMVKTLSSMKGKSTESLPFLIVEGPPTHRYYTELVVPMDYDKKYKQVLRWVTFLSHYYQCNVDIIKRPITDKSNKRALDNNLYFTKKILDSKEIIFGIKTADPKEPFFDEVNKFVKEIDADIVLVMSNTLKISFGRPKVKFGVPVMYVNPLSLRYQRFN